MTHFEASRNVILHTRYVSTYVGAGCGRVGEERKQKPSAVAHVIIVSFLRVSVFTLLTCDMYMSDLRHIHDPVLSSLKMEGIRLLFLLPLSMIDSIIDSVMHRDVLPGVHTHSYAYLR
jgi:hypothetical protein